MKNNFPGALLMLGSVLLALVLLLPRAQAAKPPKLIFNYEPMTVSPKDASLAIPTKEEAEALLAQADKAPARKPTSITDDSMMSEPVKKFRDILNGTKDETGKVLTWGLGIRADGTKIRTTDLKEMAVEIAKLDKALQEVADVKANSPNDQKILAAQIGPMKHFKSFIYRMTPVVKPARVLRQSIVDLVQDIYADLTVYMPSNEWEVGFAYLTQPVDDTLPAFGNEAEVQNFLAKSIYPELVNSIDSLSSINIDSEKPVVWDNQIFYGRHSFPGATSPSDRFVTFRNAELRALMATLHRQAYLISLGCIYNNQGLVAFAREMSELYGMKVAENKIAPSLFNQMAPSRDDRMRVLKHDQFKNSFKKNPAAQQWAERSIDHLKSLVSHSMAAWVLVSNSPDDDLAILVPGFHRGKKEVTKKMFAELVRQVWATKEISVHSVITNKTVEVNFPAFINSLPEDAKSLLPKDFNNNKLDELQTTVRGKPVPFRNFGRGKAIGWDTSHYEALFPQLKKVAPQEKNEKLQEYMQIWSESRGGIMLAEFVRPFVR